MKKITFVLIAILFIAGYSCITDQKKYKETDLYEEFEADEGFTILHLPPVLFKIILSGSDDSELNSKELFNKIDLIKVMFFEENDHSLTKEDLKKSMDKKITDLDYNLLTRIAQENNDISIYIINKEDIIHEVLITILSEKEYVSLNIIGTFTKDEVLKVYKAIDLQKMKSMEG